MPIFKSLKIFLYWKLRELHYGSSHTEDAIWGLAKSPIRMQLGKWAKTLWMIHFSSLMLCLVNNVRFKVCFLVVRSTLWKYAMYFWKDTTAGAMVGYSCSPYIIWITTSIDYSICRTLNNLYRKHVIENNSRVNNTLLGWCICMSLCLLSNWTEADEIHLCKLMHPYKIKGTVITE